MTNKKQINIRIPQELVKRLEKHVNKIGISKSAFILNLIFKELEEIGKSTRAENVDDD